MTKTRPARKDEVSGLGAWSEADRREALDRLLAERMGPDYELRRAAAVDLLERLADPSISGREIAAAIARDHELEAYIREREDRPFFGAVTRDHDLGELLLILGREKIARLVLAQALRRAFRPGSAEARKLSRALWREGRQGAEFAVRVAVEAAQRQDGGVCDLRALDLVYGRTIFTPLAAVIGLCLADLDRPIATEAEVRDLSAGEIAAMVMLSWGGSAQLASDLAGLEYVDRVRDRVVDLMAVGIALARLSSQGHAMPPSPATLERLGFGEDTWPELLPES